jgi:hypothetical protein
MPTNWILLNSGTGIIIISKYRSKTYIHVKFTRKSRIRRYGFGDMGMPWDNIRKDVLEIRHGLNLI